jgi:transposase
MEIDIGQYEKLKHILPVQRGNVTVENMTLINALLYMCENGCKWRRLPKEYGNWHVIYKRFNRWVKAGVIERLFRELHVQGVAEMVLLIRLLDSMTVPVHPDACGALKKTENRQSDAPEGDLPPKST